MFAIDLRQIDALVAAEHREGEVRRAGLIGVRHRGMAVLFELKRRRPVVLHRVAQAMQRADAGVAAPREDEFFRAAHADQLVVDQIGRHADQRQPLPSLADRLMPGSEGDQMRKPLHGDAVAVVEVAADRIGEGHEFGHQSSVKRRRTRSRCRPACGCRSGRPPRRHCRLRRAISVSRRSAGTLCRIGSRAFAGPSSEK